MISVVIPAHNEALELPRTLDALAAALADALGGTGIEHEVIVVDDASTDGTGDIARARGVRVEGVELRQIAAVRNAGARVARGEWLLFVDADTRVKAETLREMLDAMRRGVVGGGALVSFEPPVPLGARVFVGAFMLFWRPLNYAAGCFLFARRTDFEAVGGFDERYFASEEIWLSRALRERGSWTIARTPVQTSARKARMTTALGLIGTSLRLLLRGPKGWQRREGLELWYGDVRESR
jgi:glycosyltransferase involved in cell wall biosynthesis